MSNVWNTARSRGREPNEISFPSVPACLNIGQKKKKKRKEENAVDVRYGTIPVNSFNEI